MKKLLSILLLALAIMPSAMAQTMSEIKASGSGYLWAEGTGASKDEAAQDAVGRLIRQISVSVYDDFKSRNTSSMGTNGILDEQQCEHIMRTYSGATLTNVRHLEGKEKGLFTDFVYIKEKEIDRIFASRVAKVKEYTRIGNRALESLKIDEAMRHYYWAYVLLQSTRYPGEVKVTDENDDEFVAGPWLQAKLNELFADVKAKVLGKQSGGGYAMEVTYNGKPVASADFTYNYGNGWGEVVYPVQDGRAIIDIYGTPPADISLRWEYRYEDQALCDKELQQVLAMGATDMPKAERTVYINAADFKQDVAEAAPQVVPQQPKSTNMMVPTAAVDNYDSHVQQLIKAIGSGNVASVSSLFTDEGFDIFKRLTQHYGKARVVGTPTLEYVRMGDETVCRSIPMQFSFSKGRKFAEQVSLTFNKEGLISDVVFGLGQVATHGMFKYSDDMSALARQIVIRFIENYKTAYALQRADYLESIFDDDAVIITGRVLAKAGSSGDKGAAMNRYVQLTKQSKSEYIANLRKGFDSKEYINLHFADGDVTKSARGGELYGIQLKQDYFSSNYGDSGYLFLMVDLNNPAKPVIHVRAWQPQPDPEWGLVDLAKFK